MKEFPKLTIIAALGIIAGACSHQVIQSRESVPINSEVRRPSSDVLPSEASQHRGPAPQYFDWPVDEARMTRGFLPNRRRPHLGVDLAAPKGTQIYASHEGVVIYTGREFKGYGKMVMIEGPDGWATLYAHFSKIKVKEGQAVKQGDVIGAMGSTGRSTGSHLHFEIRRLRGPVDPLLYLPKIKRLASASLNPDSATKSN